MGLFWDKLKRFFYKPAILADQLPQYERNERADHSDDQLDAIRYAYEQKAFKQSSGQDVELLKNVYVGCDPIRSNPRLHIRKMKSQRKNWQHWKRRVNR
jgi:hypothetical protein